MPYQWLRAGYAQDANRREYPAAKAERGQRAPTRRALADTLTAHCTRHPTSKLNSPNSQYAIPAQEQTPAEVLQNAFDSGEINVSLSVALHR